MTSVPSDKALFIGWDVGGWNCDKNPRSRDALVVLDSDRSILGKPWRGNIRKVINHSGNSYQFIQWLLELCEVGVAASVLNKVVLAIDTPLAFSNGFTSLLKGEAVNDLIGDSETNPYLFRYTEQYLSQRGLRPLSAIKDMIGSQATKGMHVLAKFAPEIRDVGVWTNDGLLDVIEAYPSSCKHSSIMERLCRAYMCDEHDESNKPSTSFMKQSYEQLSHDDERDALLCALMAWLYIHQPDSLIWPDSQAPESEGWIFVPQDFMPEAKPIITITHTS